MVFMRRAPNRSIQLGEEPAMARKLKTSKPSHSTEIGNGIWHNAFDAMSDAVAVLDRQFHILACNQAMCRLLDLSREKIIGKHCWEAVHGRTEPLPECPSQRVMISRKRESLELTINARFYNVTVDPLFDDQGEIGCFIHIITDVTEKKGAETALREAHETLLTVLDNINAMIYVVDRETFDILFMNRYMKEELGSDYTRHKCWEAFQRYDSGPCENCKAIALTQGAGAVGRCTWEGLNQITGRWYTSSERIIQWLNGRWVRLHVATDVTAIKSYEKERQLTEVKLRQAQKMEAIGTLAGGIAHDFNNILSAILGYSELALDDSLKNKPSVAFIQHILRAGYRARDLVQQILTFSRQTETEAKPIQVRPIIKEALKLLRASLPSTIEITSDVECDAIVEADPTQIHQVIMNLCTNAGHAMRQNGGSLHVSLKNESLDSQIGGTSLELPPGTYLCLAVNDTGHGIAQTIMHKIFDPYFTTKEKGEGTGMGLAVVQGIVHSCRGAITVESTPKMGTTFKVYLPAILDHPDIKSEAEMIIPGGTERILFVDDEMALAELGKQMLERYGYHVTLCTNSSDALALFEKNHDAFDLIISDMTMPHMTGDVLAKKILEIRPNMPIVICTGYSERVTPEMIGQLGIKALVMKPIIRADLGLAVRQALET
jgi:PAS domain S-box-containing protein